MNRRFGKNDILLLGMLAVVILVFYMDAALGCTADSLPALPPYLHLLGGKKDALPLLKNCTLPVSHSLARLRGSGDACTQMVEAQLAAADFGTLCRVSPEAMGGLLRQKNIFLT